MDEELARAVKKTFYESYKTWKIDHPNDGKKKQVNLLIRMNINSNSDSSVG